ncbi:MAG: inorganic diphosphatase [Janthinobacterium lividum]
MKQQKEPTGRIGLADPTELEPFKRKPKNSTSGTAEAGEELLQVVIETPRGSRNKYSYDEDDHIFRLKAALPAGMVFPYDFGFVPQCLGGDDDPMDVLVLMDEPAFPGCVLLARLVGVMESEQTEQGETQRNDRLIAVAETAHLYSNIRTIDDIPKQALTEIEEFFANYHKLQGRSSRRLAWSGADVARKLIEDGLEKAKKA